jgi:hypothetical protein
MGRQWISLLNKLDACPEAIVWAEKYKSLDLAWSKCKRGDWMLWLAGKSCETENDKKLLVLATCECARLSLKYIPKNELRPLKAIETAEAWARNKKGITLEKVHAAYADAAYAADAYAAAAAADAARTDILKICADIIRKYYPDPPKF